MLQMRIFAKKMSMKPTKGLPEFKGSRRRNGGLPKLRGMFISPNSIVRQPQPSFRTSFFDPENELVVTAEEWKQLRYNE